MTALRKIPTSVWRCPEFDCEKVFQEIFQNVESFEEIQEEIKGRLDENTEFFTRNCTAITESQRQISSSLVEISTIFDLETERMEGSLGKAKGFAGELERVAGDIIKLALERKELKQILDNKKQLEIINNGLDLLDSLLNSKNCDYREVSKQFSANISLLEKYRAISDSEASSVEIERIQERISEHERKIYRQVLDKFDKSFDNNGNFVAQDPASILGCCLAADALAKTNLKAELIEIYLKKQFSGYRYFNPTSVAVIELKKLSNRSKYAQKTLNLNEQVFKLAFPEDWNMDIFLAQSLSNWIKEDIVSILSAVPLESRVSEDLFMQSLSEANSFDRYIKVRFDNKSNRIKSTVTQAFQDFHYFLFEAKEDEFNALKSQILPKDCTKSIHKILNTENRQLYITNFDRFFQFFSEVLEIFVHLSSMSTGVLLVQFSFFVSDCLESLNQYIENQFDLIATSKKWNEDVGSLLCYLLNTLDYCLTNSDEISREIVSKITLEDLKLQVTLESAQQKMLVNRTVGMSVLLSRFDSELQPILQQYLKTDWEQLDFPMDPSNFYLKVVETFEQTSKFPLPRVLKTLKPHLCEIFLEKFVNGFVAKLQGSLFKFKLVNEIGAEQLMIDLFSFRSYFTQRIVINSWKGKELARWSQTVAKATDKYELCLKIMLTPIDPIGPFVQSYLLLLTDFNLGNFCKFLEIKGIFRKSEQQAFLDEFHKHVPPTPEQVLEIGEDYSSTSPPSTVTLSHTASGMISSVFSRLKSSLSVVNVIKRSYTRPIRNSRDDGFLK